MLPISLKRILLLSLVASLVITSAHWTLVTAGVPRLKDVVPMITWEKDGKSVQGSGVIGFGMLLTAYHVIAGAGDARIRVRIENSGWLGVDEFVLRRAFCKDPGNDVASTLIPFRASYLRASGPVAIVNVGDKLVLAGWPRGRYAEFEAEVRSVTLLPYTIEGWPGFFYGPLAEVSTPEWMTEDLSGMSGGAAVKDGALVGLVVVQSRSTVGVNIGRGRCS